MDPDPDSIPTTAQGRDEEPLGAAYPRAASAEARGGDEHASPLEHESAPGLEGGARRLILRAWPEDERQHRSGRIELRGEEHPDVAAWTPEDSQRAGRVTVEWNGDTAIVTVDGDAAVRAPRQIDLIVERLPGALDVAAIAGSVRVEAVGVAVALRDVGPVHLEQVGANVRVEGVKGHVRIVSIGAHGNVSDVRGDVHIEHVGAHAAVRDIDGDVQIGHVGGHAQLHGVGGASRVDAVGGHLRAGDFGGPLEASVGGHAKLGIASAQSVSVRAGGHIRCQIAKEVGVDLVLASGGGLKVDAQNGGHAAVAGRHAWSGSVGGGGPKVELSSGGALKVSTTGEIIADSAQNGAEQWGEWADDIDAAAAAAASGAVRAARGLEDVAEGIAARVAGALEGLEARLEGMDLREADLVRVRQRVEHMGERFAERLEQRLGRAAARVARAGLRGERHGERHGERYGGRGPGRGRGGGRRQPWANPEAEVEDRAAAAAAPGATGDEVMTILRMLEEKRISAEEAERLLSALSHA